MDDLVKRLRIAGRQRSESARLMAEAKSLRQESNPEGLTDLYMWPTPEQTVEWRAADALEDQAARIAQLERDLAEARGKALEEAAGVAYFTCAETRHVSLGEKCSTAIRALSEKKP